MQAKITYDEQELNRPPARRGEGHCQNLPELPDQQGFLWGWRDRLFEAKVQADAFSPWPAREGRRREIRPQKIAKKPGHKKSNRLFKKTVSCSLIETDR
jgi:hypothetical protein